MLLVGPTRNRRFYVQHISCFVLRLSFIITLYNEDNSFSSNVSKNCFVCCKNNKITNMYLTLTRVYKSKFLVECLYCTTPCFLRHNSRHKYSPPFRHTPTETWPPSYALNNMEYKPRGIMQQGNRIV